ncbi:MAG TPA: trypsin-like peptidase domain-containing protein [Terriglobales bacterium]|nr:trypsin-like peptidase domain-containing protein [Terriglobales bacterium]
MASATRAVWAEFSEDLARVAESVGQSVVALQPADAHACSGVLWQKAVVVTANHSTRNDQLAVILPDGKSASARIKGRDPSTDLAIFTIEAEGEPAISPRGDAAALRVGHLVLALARTRRGNLTASSGIISGLMGAWQTWQGGQIDRFIRPDLTLYRGYSGGPLVNAKGEIVGINTAGLRRGTPITIPASTVSRVVEEVLAKGHVERPYLGVALQPVSLPEELRTRLSIGSRHGLLLVHVESDGPAAAAGLMLGDMVIEIGGKPIPHTYNLRALMATERVGERVALGIVRSNERKAISVTLGDRFGR